MTNHEHIDNIATRDRDRDLLRIARKYLDLETLETRKSDSLDFHDTAVWSIRAALNAAYAAGYEQAVADHEPPGRDTTGSES